MRRSRGELIAPLDLGPPLEPLQKLVSRAEHDAELAWYRDHGHLPLWSPFYIFSPGQLDDYHWLRGWLRDHLFELPSVGTMPQGQWVDVAVDL